MDTRRLDDAGGPAEVPTEGQLFWTCVQIAARSFGGAAAWTRLYLVERRRWMSPEEFTEALGVGQILPGPNVVNVLIDLGYRARGLTGAIAALTGLVAVPSAVAILCDGLLLRWMHIGAVQGALRGLAGASAGLVLAMGIDMGRPLRRDPSALLLAALTFVAAGLLRVPLLWVVGLLGPAGVVVANRSRR